MNKVVEEQLKKVKVANLPPYNEDTLHLVIPKSNTEVKSDLVVGNCYLLQLEDYIVKPFDGFSLHDNWNKGIPPKHNFVKAEIVQIMGKMVKINSIGYDFMSKVDTTDVWEGWVPRKSFKILEVL